MMKETIINIINNEPLATALFVMIVGYITLRITGLWGWLPNKLLESKFKTQNLSKSKGGT